MARATSPSRRFDSLVEIQNPPVAGDAATQDEFGSVDNVGGWIPLTQAWCSITPSGGAEEIRGGKTVMVRHFAIGMRRRKDLTYRQRLLVLGTGMYAGAIFNIVTVTSDGGPRSATITVMVKEGQP